MGVRDSKAGKFLLNYCWQIVKLELKRKNQTKLIYLDPPSLHHTRWEKWTSLVWSWSLLVVTEEGKMERGWETNKTWVVIIIKVVVGQGLTNQLWNDRMTKTTTTTAHLSFGKDSDRLWSADTDASLSYDVGTIWGGRRRRNRLPASGRHLSRCHIPVADISKTYMLMLFSIMNREWKKNCWWV